MRQRHRVAEGRVLTRRCATCWSSWMPMTRKVAAAATSCRWPAGSAVAAAAGSSGGRGTGGRSAGARRAGRVRGSACRGHPGQRRRIAATRGRSSCRVLTWQGSPELTPGTCAAWRQWAQADDAIARQAVSSLAPATVAQRRGERSPARGESRTRSACAELGPQERRSAVATDHQHRCIAVIGKYAQRRRAVAPAPGAHRHRCRGQVVVRHGGRCRRAPAAAARAGAAPPSRRRAPPAPCRPGSPCHVRGRRSGR